MARGLWVYWCLFAVLRGLLHLADTVAHSVKVVRVFDGGCYVFDHPQVFDPGPQPIGDKSQVLRVAPLAGS